MSQKANQLRDDFRRALSDRPQIEADQSFFTLLEYFCGISKTRFLMDPGQGLSAECVDRLNKLLARLKEDEPLQYLVGEVNFAGINLKVAPGVLIPRPETEELFSIISQEWKSPNHPKIIDLGTGSGCLALALKKRYPAAQVWGVDISDKALAIARENAARNDLAVNFKKLDLLREVEKLPCDFDLLVSNPPYIARSEQRNLAKRVKNYEPEEALFAPGDDALAFYRRIRDYFEKLPGHAEGYLEINAVYAEQSKALFAEVASETRIIKDIFKNHRFLRVQK